MGNTTIVEIKEKIESQIRAGKLKKALKEIKSAGKKFLADPYLIYYKGLVHWNQKEYEEAIASFEECLKSALIEEGGGIYGEFKKGLVYYYIGLSHDMLGNTEEAVIQLEKAVREEPNNYEFQDTLEELKSDLKD